MPPLSALGRTMVERGVEKMNRRLSCGARVAAAESENGKTHGRGRRAADVWGQVAAVASKCGETRRRCWATSWATLALGLAGLRGLLLPFFFSFLFFISFPLFEFKFGLKFEFQTDVTYSLEFREFCLAILYINIGVVCYI
jgi:hypothetical protein